MSDASNTLLQVIDTYLESTGMAETTFGKLAANDRRFVGRLRAGGRVWPETQKAVLEFIAKGAPEGFRPRRRRSQGTEAPALETA